jgi:PTH1 family peptidyl-tRNA hydrolase
MHILVGLGNIGAEYAYTRHNFGFLLLDKIIADYKLTQSSKKSLNEIFTGEIAGQKIIAIKPQTYMNRSGEAVLAIRDFYKIPLQNILVFHDDVDLELGKVKAKIGGGSAGHNGLKSIDEIIEKDYLRLRLGIGRPENKEFKISDYVLSKFSEDEIKIVEMVNRKASNLLATLLNGKITEFMNQFDEDSV